MIDLDLPAGPYVRVEVAGRTLGQPATLEILGQTLTGNFAFEQVTNAAGQRVVRIGVSQVGLRIGDGTQLRGAGADGQGAFELTPAGMAGRIEATVSIPLIGFSGTLGLAINNTTARVNERILVGGETLIVDLPAGPYLRVEGTNISLSIAGQSLSGDFSFERSNQHADDSRRRGPDDCPRRGRERLAAPRQRHDGLRARERRTRRAADYSGRARGHGDGDGGAQCSRCHVCRHVQHVHQHANAAVNEVFTVGGVGLTTALSALHGGNGIDLGGDGADFRITRAATA